MSAQKLSKNKKNISNNKLLNDKEELVEVYELMQLIRKFEEKAGQAYGMGLIGGFCHLYIGQEAVIAGTKKALIDGDAIITSYRDHGHILACGTDPNPVMAELFGKETGVSRGKGGSMHLFDTEKHFYGGHGIVGAQVPIGTGVAFALKYNETNNIAVTFMGDGAANQGQVYESFNMAALWNLPVLYIIENNVYGMGTSVDRASASEDFVRRGEPYGIKGEIVDGMDFFAMYDAVERAAAYIRETKMPYLLEAKTYRYRGHSMSDPGKYRSKEEVNDYKQNSDPINAMKEHIIKIGGSEEEIKAIDKKIKKIVEEAINFAKESPEPIASELWTDVYR